MEGPKAKAETKHQNKVQEESPILERIKSLLRKAKDPAASTAEAEEAGKMAHKLMGKYKISIKGIYPQTVQSEQSSEAARQRDQFTQNTASDEEREEFVKERQQSYLERVIEKSIKHHAEMEAKLAAEANKAQTPNNSALAVGLGENSSGWESTTASPGLFRKSDTQREKTDLHQIRGKVSFPKF